MGSHSGPVFAAGDASEPDEDAIVLLLMEPDRDRELLSEALRERYRVVTGTTGAALETRFDCCLLGDGVFDDVAEQVATRREQSAQGFLPFVLLAGGSSRTRRTDRVWSYVDDLIELPVNRRTLLARIENLIERRRTSVRLKRTIGELRLKERAMDEAPVGITLARAEGEDNPLVYLNEEFAALTGYGPEVLGNDCRFLQGEDTSEEARAAIRAAIDDERAVSVDILNYRANGQKFWNQLTLAPLREDDGTVSHFVGFQTDITDRKIRERRLEVMSRVLRHNLRNKMNLIEGYADLLNDAVGDGEHRREIDVIAETAADLLGIAEAVGKVDETLSAPEPSAPISLRDQLLALEAAFRSRFPDATFRLSLPGDDPIEATVVGLAVAIEEAVENAVKHNDAATPSVHVRVERLSDGWIGVEIEDDGPGIPDHETRVLESGETSLNHADRLGIWLMYWVVSRAGGEFFVDTDRNGTTIRMEIPANP